MATPTDRITFSVELGTQADGKGGRKPRLVQMYVPNEQQILTLMRIRDWMEQAEENPDEKARHLVGVDMVNTYLTLLEALFVERAEMVRAMQRVASGDPDRFTEYVELAGVLVEQYAKTAEEPAPTTGPRSTKRAVRSRPPSR